MPRIPPRKGPPVHPKEDFGEKVKAHIRYKTASGVQVPGVTTITGLLNKPFLIKWANDLGLQGIDSTAYRDEAADIGKLAHEVIMCELRGQPLLTADFTANQITRASHALNAYHLWRRDFDLKAVLVEQPLVSEVYRYGGTIDCLATLNGRLELIDYKTSKAIYDEHFLQVAAYWKLLEEHGYQIQGARILRIPRVPGESFGQESISGRRLLRDWKQFSHLLEVYRLRKRRV